jgi:hypothetical protein
MAFAEPNMLNPQVFAMKTFLRKKLPSESPDETAFIRWSLIKKLWKVGFEEIEITPVDWLHPSMPSQLINFMKIAEGLFEKIPLVKEFSGSLLIKARKP